MPFRLTNSNAIVLVACCAALGSLAAVCGLNQWVLACSCLLLFAVFFSFHLLVPYFSGFMAQCLHTDADQQPDKIFVDDLEVANESVHGGNLWMILLVYAAIAVLPIFFYARANQCQPKARASDLAQFVGREVIFDAELCHDDAVHGHLVAKPEMLLFPKKMSLTGESVLMFSLPPGITESKGRVRISAFVRAPESPSSGWEFDQRRYLAEHAIYSMCFRAHLAAGTATVVPEAGANEEDGLSGWRRRFCSAIKDARERMVAMHRRHLQQEYGDLLSSIVLGNRAVSLDGATTRRYRDVGLSHLLAASGFNLTIVTVMSITVCALFTRSMLIANTLSVGSILAFVAIAGPSPSVVRAALMCFAVLLAKNSKRKIKVLSVLALAFIITDLCDPCCISDLGFQLSYASTIGILCGATALSRFVYAGRRRLLKYVVSALALVLIAQASVLPIQLLNFWQTGTLFVPANLIAEPLITPITILGFGSSVASLIHCDNGIVTACVDWLTTVIDYLAFVPLKILSDCVYFLSSIQGCTLSVGPPMSASIALYYACLSLSYLSFNKRRHHLIAFSAFAVALSCLLFYRWPPAKLTIAILPNHVIVMDQEHHAFAISRRREYPPTSLPSGKLDDINKKDSFSQASKDAVDADEHDLKVEKCLAYHGARIDPRYFNVSGQGKNDCTIIALRQFNVIIVGSARTTTGAQCAHAHPEIASAGVISPSKEGTRNVLLLLDQQRRSVKSADGLAASVLQSYHPEIVVLQDGSKRLSSSCHFDLPHNYQQNNCADVQIEHSSDIRLRTFVSVCR